jgi:transcription initiation factor TFIID TATA-box-binding protein
MVKTKRKASQIEPPEETAEETAAAAVALEGDTDALIAHAFPRVKRSKVLPAYPLKVRNTVHTAILNRRFHLPALAICLRGRYGRSMFPAASFRFARPFVTLSVFEEGKMVITGTDDFQEALRAAHMFCRLLWKKMDIDARFVDFRRQNMVGSLALGYGLDLPRLYRDFQRDRHKKVQYHETFPGLRYWPGEDEQLSYDQKRLVLILFTSGAVVISGAKSKQQIIDTVTVAIPKLEPYRLA